MSASSYTEITCNDYGYIKKVWDALMLAVNNEVGVAALMGNLYKESYIYPGCAQGDSSPFSNSAQIAANFQNGTWGYDVWTVGRWPVNGKNYGSGFGLAQWTYITRKEGYWQYWKAHTWAFGSYDLDINYLINYELAGGYASTKAKMQEGNASDYKTSIWDISSWILANFENPAVQDEKEKDQRAGWALWIYNNHSGTTPIPPQPGTDFAVSPASAQGKPGDVLSFDAVNAEGNVSWTLDSTSWAYATASADTSHCTVTITGGIGQTVRLTATDGAGNTASALITITDTPPQPGGQITITPASIEAGIGQETEFSVYGYDGTVLWDVPPMLSVTYRNPNTRSIKVRGTMAGTYDIKATSQEGYIAYATFIVSYRPGSTNRSGKWIYYIKKTV